jgi:hypothetical protein
MNHTVILNDQKIGFHPERGRATRGRVEGSAVAFAFTFCLIQFEESQERVSEIGFVTRARL